MEIEPPFPPLKGVRRMTALTLKRLLIGAIHRRRILASGRGMNLNESHHL
jgi:hypothetical protein